MTSPNIDYEAALFLFDLDNRRRKLVQSDEKWEIVIASAKEKKAIEKTISRSKLEGSVIDC